MSIWNLLQEQLVWAVSDSQASSLTMTKHSPQSHCDSFLFLNNLWCGSLSRQFWKVKGIMSTCLVTSSENSGWLDTSPPTGNHWLSVLNNPRLLCNFQTWIYLSLNVFLSLCSVLRRALKKSEGIIFSAKQRKTKSEEVKKYHKIVSECKDM